MTDVEVELNELYSEGAKFKLTNKRSIKEWFANKLHRLRYGIDELEFNDITEAT